MILAYSYCNASVMPVRKEPMHSSEQTTQLLFGEKAEVLEVNNREWARIRVGWDDYEGWCKLSQLTIIQKKEYRKEVKYLAGSHKDKLVMQEGEMWIPLGSELLSMKSSSGKPVSELGKFKGRKLNIRKNELTFDNLKNAAMHFLHAPYQWGGRSVAGIDCSGLTQMAFKLCNHRITRDAGQQAQEGQLVDFLQNAQCGDLAFFDNAEGKITHVGMLLDDHTIIHSTEIAGRVVIDRIDQGGIISVSLRRRTHNLRMVKRMF